MLGAVVPNSMKGEVTQISELAREVYRSLFDQDLPWVDELADVYCEEEDVYLKCIARLDVPSVLYALVLNSEFPNSYTIIDGEANQCVEAEPSDCGELTGLHCPHLKLFTAQAGVHVEFKGLLYESGDLTDEAEDVWKPTTDPVMLAVFNKYIGEDVTAQKEHIA